MISTGDRVVAADAQLFGNSSVLANGEVLAISGTVASVMLDGEEVPRDFNLDKLNSASEVYGFELPGPNENQVIDAIRR